MKKALRVKVIENEDSGSSILEEVDRNLSLTSCIQSYSNLNPCGIGTLFQGFLGKIPISSEPLLS